jgi:DNA processing protein
LEIRKLVMSMSPGISLEDLLGRPLNDVEKKYAPKQIFSAGRKIPLSGPRAAIVGSRSASRDGLDLAEQIASFLVSKRVVIVSGLARGIDTVAHQTAIKRHGDTVAVLGTPLDKWYPVENAQLQEIIMRNHWAISQFPEGYPILRKNFVMRNRTMALISDISIIVQAGEKSGSLHQGWEALRLGRPLFICSPIVQDGKLDWPQRMMQYGATELREPEQLMEVLPSPEGTPEILA